MKKKILCLILSTLILFPPVPIHAKQCIKLNKTSVVVSKSKTYILSVPGTNVVNLSLQTA